MEISKLAQDYNELRLQIEAQGRAINDIRDTQMKIANALLGSFDKGSIGLIEEQRTLRKEMDINNATTNLHSTQINELQTFRNDIKKVVAAIAIVIPIAFELLKGLASVLWSAFSGK